VPPRGLPFAPGNSAHVDVAIGEQLEILGLEIRSDHRTMLTGEKNLAAIAK